MRFVSVLFVSLLIGHCATLKKAVSFTPSTGESWQKTETWLKSRAPELYHKLGLAAKEKNITALEQELGRELPADFKDMYRRHDGMTESFTSLYYGMIFWNTKEVLVNKDELDLGVPLGRTSPGIKDQSAGGWIPFAFNETGSGLGTFLAVDLDPGEGGDYGQIIFVDPEHSVAILVAGNTDEFMASFVWQLESGKYELDRRSLMDGEHVLIPVKEYDITNWYFTRQWAKYRPDHK